MGGGGSDAGNWQQSDLTEDRNGGKCLSFNLFRLNINIKILLRLFEVCGQAYCFQNSNAYLDNHASELMHEQFAQEISSVISAV